MEEWLNLHVYARIHATAIATNAPAKLRCNALLHSSRFLPHPMSTCDLIDHLKHLGALREDDVCRIDSLDSIRPDFMSDWPSEVHPEVQAKLADSGLRRPYRHQYDAVKRFIAGKHVVLESPTASGKTLAFTVPILDALYRDPHRHALLIYPMKALAFDQQNQLATLGKPLGVGFWPYDGDTRDEHKKWLRNKPCHALLTTPDYLNMAFLGHKEKWINNGFLSNLHHVVIDEMHEYRGYFGTNAALLFRRFFTLLDRLGVQPTVFLSTATCENPDEHAKNLTGLDIQHVSARDVLRPKRHFVFVKPAIPEFKYMDNLRSRIVRAALTFHKRREQVLVFCPSKQFLEGALGQCRNEIEKAGENPDDASAFHADIKSTKKQNIQLEIKEGRIRIVFTTNALELGIDIGGLDAIILAGFPATIMSAWQQIGRAGRKWDKEAYVVIYAMNDPIDSFFVTNMQTFLKKPFDELVIDPSNQEVINKHVPSLIMEVDENVLSSDEERLGPVFHKSATEEDVALPHGYRPQIRLSLRGMYGDSFKLRDGQREIGKISELRRFREAYIGAIFPFMGQQYVVKAYQAGEVVLGRAEKNRKTEPTFFRMLKPSELFEGIKYGKDLKVYYGTLSITHQFTGYRLINTQTKELINSDSTKAAMYNSGMHAFWLESPASKDWVGATGGVEHMMRVGSLFILPIDRFDLSTFSNPQAAYCYEGYEGGIGIAKKIFSVWEKVLQEGIKVAESCKCRKGCPNCIQPAKAYDISQDIDKQAGLELARQLLFRCNDGPTHKLVNGRWCNV